MPHTIDNTDALVAIARRVAGALPDTLDAAWAERSPGEDCSDCQEGERVTSTAADECEQCQEDRQALEALDKDRRALLAAIEAIEAPAEPVGDELDDLPPWEINSLAAGLITEDRVHADVLRDFIRQYRD